MNKLNSYPLSMRLEPHSVRGDKNIWWYEDKTGIDVYVRSSNSDVVRICNFRIYWKDLLSAARRCGKLSEKRKSGYTLIKDDVLKFLRGEGPLENHWFDDQQPVAGKPKHKYWWRKYLRKDKK